MWEKKPAHLSSTYPLGANPTRYVLPFLFCFVFLQAQEVHLAIRAWMGEKVSPEVAEVGRSNRETNNATATGSFFILF